MAKKQGTNIGIIPLTLILAAITLIFIMAVRSQYGVATVNRVASPASKPKVETIRSTEDLDDALVELDNTDPSSLNQELNAIGSDASAF